LDLDKSFLDHKNKEEHLLSFKLIMKILPFFSYYAHLTNIIITGSHKD